MNRRLVLSPTGLLTALLSLCLAAAPGQTPAKPAAGAAPIVTVTKANGSTLRGKLTAAGPASITVEVAGVGATPPADIAWKYIKSVSNGLTQIKALQQFKAEHADELCDTCHGNTSLVCATCKGTGHDPASGKDCKTCKGELLVACRASKCKEGKVPCPAPCLKLSEGKWTVQEGMKVRTFPGGAWISEKHIGTMVSFDKAGQMVDKGVCPTCGGTTAVTCPTCGGTSKVTCPTCLARKDAPSCAAHCDKGREICKGCDGTGLKRAAPAAADPSAPVVNDAPPAESGGPKSSPPAVPPPDEPKKPDALPF
jgi:hypothetical protein